MLTDAHREARKAFLALSSDEVSAEPAVSEGVKSDVQNVVDLLSNDDHKSSESTPVSIFSLLINNCKFLLHCLILTLESFHM